MDCARASASPVSGWFAVSDGKILSDDATTSDGSISDGKTSSEVASVVATNHCVGGLAAAGGVKMLVALPLPYLASNVATLAGVGFAVNH